MLSCTSKRSHRHTILHVSFSNSFGLASARPTPQGLSGAPQKAPDGSVESTGDDLTGGNSDGGDDETLNVDLTKVSPQIQEIIFTATIYKAEERRQNFGQVRNSYIRIYDAKTDTEIARYDLDEDFSVETAVEFGRLYRHNGEWKFEAIGNGNKGGLQALVNKYAKQFA